MARVKKKRICNRAYVLPANSKIFTIWSFIDKGREYDKAWAGS